MKSFIQKFQSSSLVLFDQMIVSGMNFLVGILLTRWLGLEEYGTFVLLWMLVLFALSIGQAFITKPMVSFAPQMETDDYAEYIASLHGMQLLLSLLSVTIGIIGLTLASQFEWFSSLGLLEIFSLASLLGSVILYDYYRKFYFLNQDVKSALFSDSLLALVQILGMGVLYQLNLLSLSNFLLLMSASYALVGVIGFFKNINPDFSSQRLEALYRKHMRFSKWLLGTVLLQWFNGNFFIIAAGGILGASMVGAIRIAQNVIGLTHVIFLAMENVIPIHAARNFKEGGKEKLFTFLQKTGVKIGYLVLSLLILIALLSPILLEFLYGQEYRIYSYVLIGFCIIYLLVYIGYPLRFALRTLELTKPIFIAYCLGAVFSLLTAYPLIQNWQILGLLVGLFIAQLISQLVYIFSLWKTKKAYENHPLGSR